MMTTKMRRSFQLLASVLTFLALNMTVQAQTTGFTYQGRLTDNGAAANGTYDLQFALFDNSSGGTQIGPTQTVAGVSVSGGVFTVTLDFGASAFPGANRFLEIRVRPTGGGNFTTLNPRQPISSTPYAIRSLNASSADSIPASGVPAGSGNYIQNSTSPQASSNFNISGTGAANTFNATTQYNIGGARVLSVAGFANVFAGVDAGINNTTGDANSFFGGGAGNANTTGAENSFFGVGAGRSNITGFGNSFFGVTAGVNNTTGNFNSFYGHGAGFSNSAGDGNSFFGRSAGQRNATGLNNSFFGLNAGFGNTSGFNNSFFGQAAGRDNTNGEGNSFFGQAAGLTNTSGSVNSFFGPQAGANNTTGNVNSFFGQAAGLSNTSESFNTFIGAFSDGQAGITNATAIGYRAKVTQSNSLVLGGINGVNGVTVGTNVGIGTTAPSFRLHVINSSNVGLRVETQASGGTVASFASNGEFHIDAPFFAGGRFIVKENGNIGLGINPPSDRLHVFGIIRVEALGLAGATTLCHNASNQISTCSSSLRYKEHLSPFSTGLELINRLRPISFNWKASDQRDIGLVAEDVEKLEPLLVTYNATGEVEGVKYDRLSVAFVNSFKELQEQIEAQAKLIREQQTQIDELKQLVLARPTATDPASAQNYDRVSEKTVRPIRGKKLVLTGVVRDGDEVLYRFRARAGQRVTARVAGRDADFTVYLNYGLDAEPVARDTKSWSGTMPPEFNGDCEIAVHSTYKVANYRLEILVK